MTASAAAHDQTLANPPRFGRLKRMAAALGVAAVFIVVLFLIWRYESRRRLDTEIARAFAEESPMPAVPDHLNAATYLVAADALIPRGGFTSPPLTTTTLPTVRGTIRAPSTAPALARTARFQPHLIWPRSLPMAPSPHEITVLAGELGTIALNQQANGMDAEAVETILDIVAATGRRGEPSPGALDLDRTIGQVLATANEAIFVIAPELHIDPRRNATTQPNGPASRAQVRALIDALLDDSTFEQPFAERLRASRAYAARYFIATPSPFKGIHFLFDPFQRLEAARLLRLLGQAADAVSAGKQRDLLRQARSSPPSRQSPMSSIIHPYGDAIIEQTVSMHYEALADRRVSAIILAIRLYQVDHPNQLPPMLEALVPMYLPGLPDDPFNPSKATFVYSTSPWPAVSSVGPNGKDDTSPKRLGVMLPATKRRIEGQGWWEDDAVYLIPFENSRATTKD
jgi:hypothetical protein